MFKIFIKVMNSNGTSVQGYLDDPIRDKTRQYVEDTVIANLTNSISNGTVSRGLSLWNEIYDIKTQKRVRDTKIIFVPPQVLKNSFVIFDIHEFDDQET